MNYAILLDTNFIFFIFSEIFKKERMTGNSVDDVTRNMGGNRCDPSRSMFRSSASDWPKTQFSRHYFLGTWVYEYAVFIWIYTLFSFTSIHIVAHLHCLDTLLSTHFTATSTNCIVRWVYFLYCIATEHYRRMTRTRTCLFPLFLKK